MLRMRLDLEVSQLQSVYLLYSKYQHDWHASDKITDIWIKSRRVLHLEADRQTALPMRYLALLLSNSEKKSKVRTVFIKCFQLEEVDLGKNLVWDWKLNQPLRNHPTR